MNVPQLSILQAVLRPLRLQFAPVLAEVEACLIGVVAKQRRVVEPGAGVGLRP